MSLVTRVNVTAVKLCREIIIAGVGSYCYVYDRVSLKLLERIHCLRGQKCYGFILSECREKVLVYGGKQFTVLIITSNNETDEKAVKITRLFDTVECNDWLHSAIWLDDVHVAVLTAHNVVQKWDTSSQSLTSTHPSPNNPILYSGLLLPLHHDVLVLAGTVFSEVLIHCCGDDNALHTLKGHRGVIFSIACKPEKKLIVTTSDDRSVRIWNINSSSPKSYDDIDYWKSSVITSTHEVYGHLARVMRSCITGEYILSVGEDSVLCFWNQEGKLLKQVVTHQNSRIWAVDADDCSVVTGGGDCGLIVHPLTVAEYKPIQQTIQVEKPKRVVFTARRNIVILSEDNMLMYYDVETNTQNSVQLNHGSTYKSISVSSCRQLVAVVDMCGNFDVFAERGKDCACLFRILNTKLNFGKILSMLWAGNRHVVFCSGNGAITVLAADSSGTDVYAEFELPPCKERWLTAAAIDHATRLIILGDRCGNIHVYKKEQRQPIKTFSKVHGRYGPTTITIKGNKITSTGRNGAIKYFTINNNCEVKFMNTKEVDIQWVEKFLDKNERVICGFQERDFVVFDIVNNTKLIEVSCGGGHRSWDAVRYVDKINGHFEEIVKFMYLKASELHIKVFELSKIAAKSIVNGSHAKEINCLNSFNSPFDKNVLYYISGGEDTTLRISSIDSELYFQDLHICKQLSNIRALKTLSIDNNKVLLVSAGGRAQVCVRLLKFYQRENETEVRIDDIVNYLIKGTDKQRKGIKKWTETNWDFDPETRIMSLDVKRENDHYLIFAGCSDAYLRIFKLDVNLKNAALQPLLEYKVYKTCILKTSIIQYENKVFLVTCSTRGQVSLFDVSNEASIENIEPVFVTNTNKSGINSFSWQLTSDQNLLIATGGDDNAVHLKLLKISKEEVSFQVLESWSTDKYHCSQITGLILLKGHLITSSIDQRVTLCKLQTCDEEIRVEYIAQTYSDVADIQGMELIEEDSNFVKICVFGMGMEVLQMRKSAPEG